VKTLGHSIKDHFLGKVVLRAIRTPARRSMNTLIVILGLNLNFKLLAS